MSLGFEIAMPVLFGAGIGYWIDRQFGGRPWGMVVGVVIGAVAGFWNAYKFAVKIK
ncbi:MAG: AtpZ/AtpI family protein [Candidatus Saganbacteria bacterium]|nr:AtpZ/AtpI family protein [Candidatus Saganbacteria bacterium]